MADSNTKTNPILDLTNALIAALTHPTVIEALTETFTKALENNLNDNTATDIQIIDETYHQEHGHKAKSKQEQDKTTEEQTTLNNQRWQQTAKAEYRQDRHIEIQMELWNQRESLSQT